MVESPDDIDFLLEFIGLVLAVLNEHFDGEYLLGVGVGATVDVGE